MKKSLSLILAVILTISLITMAGCGTKEENLKLGLGLYGYYSTATSADGDINGKGEVVVNAAAVLIDANGKIVKCDIDTADNTIEYTSAGTAISVEEFKTKYEMGEDYNMVEYGGSKSEWYAQAEAFCSVIVGKNLDEVKALIANGGKSSEEVINAGCTIDVADFVYAIEKAINAAEDSTATKNATLNVGIVTTQSIKDATEDANGETELEMTVVAAALDSDKKVIVSKSDCLAVSFKFDANGAALTDTSAKLTTKLEAGDNYNMAAYGADLNGDGIVKEWYAQADEFNKACVGKTATEISGLLLETGYGKTELQTAGCTINAYDLARAAVKATTID